MAIDEATQTNGVAQPEAGHQKKDEADKSSWTVESGMS
jgi:putative hydrolase of HD superfamily